MPLVTPKEVIAIVPLPDCSVSVLAPIVKRETSQNHVPTLLGNTTVALPAKVTVPKSTLALDTAQH